MNKTKLKILSTALDLLNQKGLVNVTLRDIAKAMNISPGNLTYHFKNRAELIELLYQNMMKDVEVAMEPADLSLSALHDILINFHNTQLNYRFIFIDLVELVRSYPAISDDHSSNIKNRMEQGLNLIQLFEKEGYFKPEAFKDQYVYLIHSIITLSTFWLAHQNTSSSVINEELNYFELMWNQLFPYLTEKGIQEYLQIKNKPAASNSKSYV